ncbi:MAG: DUF3343 domain-containing protein [Syntrophomonadaceae bacterium]|nr:DUF3343 domain-containing protein [Syntrophomonadaceae bacterium]
MDNIIMLDNFYLFTFSNTTDALKAEKVLKNNNYEHILIPTLREISSSCGLSVKVRPELTNIIKELLDSNKINFANIYRVEKKDKDYLIENIN